LYFYTVTEIPIYFFKEGIRFRLYYPEELKMWILSAGKAYRYSIQNINYIFCSDRYLLKLNKRFLNHNYFTDIITFNNSTQKKKLVADIYISIDRVKANAKKLDISFNEELHRMLIHGMLHLLGHDDKDEKKRSEMKKAEDLWLSKRTFLQK
jgi:probable rRNA maturation factor